MPLGPVVLSGAFTLALLSLPVVIITSQEALRSIPASLRHAAYALGATKWQTIWHQVLPASLPGILTGVILSLSRAIGEAAPIAVIGVAAHLSFAPGRITGISDLVQNPDKLIRAPFDRFTARPTLVYSWVNEAAPNFEHVAAAGIIVLLATLLSMNGAAILIRQRFQQWNRW
jgi:phosphate transport system permease protein